jgi:hypothetical protein
MNITKNLYSSIELTTKKWNKRRDDSTINYYITSVDGIIMHNREKQKIKCYLNKP